MAANVTRGDDIARTIYVEPPGEGASPADALPEVHPSRQPNRWRYHFPWVKTAVSAPTYDGEILIANRTGQTWLLWHNYHSLGLVDPGTERQVRVARVGTLSARVLAAPADSEYLLLALAPDLSGAEIVDVTPGEGFYTLRRMDARGSVPGAVPDSTGVKELGLSPKTINALKRLGVTTAGQLRQADLGALWDVRNGPAAYVELLEKFVLRDSQSGA